MSTKTKTPAKFIQIAATGPGPDGDGGDLLALDQDGRVWTLNGPGYGGKPPARWTALPTRREDPLDDTER